jgi:ABC-type transporter Mla subunit MlaD
MKREIKIGLFLGIALGIMAIFIFIVGDMSTLFKKPGYTLNLYFDSAAGLERNTVVRMAGVKIGHVKDIRLKGRQAEVILDIKQEAQVRKDSTASLASLGLLGEKYIEILPGMDSEICQPGDSLTVITPVSFERLGTELVTISDEIKETGKVLREMIGNEESQRNFKEILSNLAVFAVDLKEISSASKQNLNLSIERTSEAVQNFDNKVNELSKNLGELISLLRDLVEENRENIKQNLVDAKELIGKAEKSLGHLDESLDRISAGEGTLGKLIHDTDLYEQAEKTVGDIKRALDPVSSLRVSARLQFDYYAGPEVLKSYLSSNLWLTPTRFLYAELIRDPWLDKFTFSAQAGMRWGDFASRAGIMQSKIGAAVEYYLLKDRIKFSLESYDFNRRPYPYFRFATSLSATKYFYLLFGLDDFAYSDLRRVFFGLGLGL